ncbi:MAG: DUF4293 family protein [Chitinophagaceae bacterium]
MIQRIQSVWLLLASIFSFSTIHFSFFSGNILDTTTNTKMFQTLTATTSIANLIITIAIAAASLVVIFLYKDRKRQILVSIGILTLSILNIVLYYFESKKFIEGNYSLTALITLFIPMLIIAAIRGIWKDEQLIKSTDRLR